ncbi:MAG: GAF and ANTAR domain-containing protein [Actinomycetes bacterium]
MEIDSERFAEAIVVLADTLVDQFDVVDLLHELTTRCAELVGADAAGLVLADTDGVLRFVASTTVQATFVELLQLHQDEGPAIDCYSSGRQVEEADLLTAEQRWPSFFRKAVEAGFRSVNALPLRLHGDALGALNLFCRRPGGITAEHVRLAQALADLATVSMVQARRAQEQEEVAAQLQHALDSRVAIERATGLVAGRTGRDIDDAFSLLRASARRARRPLSEMSRDIVDGRMDVDSLDEGAAPGTRRQGV